MRRRIILFLAALFLFIAYILFPPFLDEQQGVPGVPQFNEIEISFIHELDKEAFAAVGSSIIDVDGDGILELFIGGGSGQEDVLFYYREGNFEEGIEGLGLSSTSATYSAVSLDIDDNGFVDMIITREDGVYLYMNQEGTFEKQKLDFNLEQDAVPVSVAPGDINNDGLVDLYVSTFPHPEFFKPSTFNDEEHGKDNILLLNKGDNTFEDITNTSGVELNQNSFLSAFIDLNSDGLQDLVVSPNTDKIRIFRNLGDLTFEERITPTGYGAWMGLDLSDYDNDGDIDLFLSNLGNFFPERFLRGDLDNDQELDTEWALLENQGEFKLTRENDRVGLSNKEFAWGASFDDFTLDGKSDLIVMENYVKWPIHRVRKSPGRFFVQNEKGTFDAVTKQANLENYHYGMAALKTDFNDDGYLDVVYVNINGPLRVLMNQGLSHKNSYVKIVLSDAASSIGTKVEVTSGEEIYTKWFIPGTGFMSDQSHEMIFGLGESSEDVAVSVTYLSGEIKEYKMQVNSKLFV